MCLYDDRPKNYRSILNSRLQRPFSELRTLSITNYCSAQKYNDQETSTQVARRPQSWCHFPQLYHKITYFSLFISLRSASFAFSFDVFYSFYTSETRKVIDDILYWARFVRCFFVLELNGQFKFCISRYLYINIVRIYLLEFIYLFTLLSCPKIYLKNVFFTIL